MTDQIIGTISFKNQVNNLVITEFGDEIGDVIGGDISEICDWKDGLYLHASYLLISTMRSVFSRPGFRINASQVHWVSLPVSVLYFANTTLSRLLLQAPQVLVVCLLGGNLT